VRRVLPVAVLLMSAAPLSAQDIDSPYRFVDRNQQVGAYAGYVITNPGDLDLGPESAPAFGARYGLRISGPFNIEAGAMLLPTTRVVQDTAISATDTAVVQVGESDLTLMMLNANLRFDITGPRTWNGFLPFALLGIGVAFPISEGENDTQVNSDVRYRFGTALVGDFGVGVEWFPLERWSVRLDARDALWKVETPLGLRQLDVPNEEWVQNFVLTAGITWRF